MIYRVSQIITTELASRGCPYRVVYGPERLEDFSFVDTRIVVQRSRGSGEVTNPPRSSRHNPPRRAERGIVGAVRVVARSSMPGAQTHDHEELADKITDMVICALQIAANRDKLNIQIGDGVMPDADDLDIDIERWPGVVYDLPFTVWRAVHDIDWEGDAAPTTDTYSFATTGACLSTAAPDP